jgi:invasion protein IalB
MYCTLSPAKKAAPLFWYLVVYILISTLGTLKVDAKPTSKFSAAPSKSTPKKIGNSAPSSLHKAKMKKTQTSSQASPKPRGPIFLAKEGLWTVYTAQQEGKGKLCYAMTRPTQRVPRTLSTNHAHLFISTRPNEGVRNEVNITLGTPLKEEDSKAKITIGSHIFPLTLKESYGWVKNVNEEKNVVVAMQKNKEVIVKVQSRNGVSITDHYSLKGLSQALTRVYKECP